MPFSPINSFGFFLFFDDNVSGTNWYGLAKAIYNLWHVVDVMFNIIGNGKNITTRVDFIIGHMRIDKVLISVCLYKIKYLNYQ